MPRKHTPTDDDTLLQRYEDLQFKYRNLLRHLQFAEEVQRCLMPRTMPVVNGVSFAAGLRPTQHMAGDFYNAFRLDRNHAGIYVGDVMGHGPAAALMSVYTMLTMHTKRIEGNTYEIIEPGAALASLNDDILAVDFAGVPFVTMVYGVLDIPRRAWTYCCGGHPQPMIVRRDQSYELLETTAPLLGVMESGFEQRCVMLEPNDRLVLYSDGALAANWGEHGSGVEGLASLFGTREGRTMQQVVDDAIETLSFSEQHPDDVTLLAIELTD